MLSHSSLGPAHLVLHKAQKQVVALLNLLGDWAAFIGAVLILGLAVLSAKCLYRPVLAPLCRRPCAWLLRRA